MHEEVFKCRGLLTTRAEFYVCFLDWLAGWLSVSGVQYIVIFVMYNVHLLIRFVQFFSSMFIEVVALHVLKRKGLV